ncbi:MAG: serine hydrolase, partial [Terriglobia bacterium]
MNRNRWLIVVVPLLLFTSVAAYADKVDDYITSEMQKRRIPGLALAVVKNGEVIKAKGYGLANVELDVPVTPDS